uniref:FlgD/Vpr Ig-like domain-containing protein n=1 Tax=candidate division WOR-3 bacterium TaxID=2052148 RepID=A0A7C6A9W3_UNCW3
MKFNKKFRFFVILGTIALSFGLEWKALYPNARANSSMIVDSLNHRIILFGGMSLRLNNRIYNDVWELPLDTLEIYAWFPLSVIGSSPPPRYDHTAVYDQVHQRMLVFGGNIGGVGSNEVWSLNLTSGSESWERLQPAGNSPTPRQAASGIYHPLRNSFIIFGGTGYYEWYNDVWELKLDSMVWREISVTGPKPAPRCFGGAVFDANNNQMIVFGGNSEVFYNDVWTLDLTLNNEHWTELHPTGSLPLPRTNFAYGYDRVNNKFYVFGGFTNQGGWAFLNDLYVLDISSLNWTQLNPSGDLPVARRNSVGIYDFWGDNFFIFGGDQYPDYYFGETFFIHFSPTDTPEWHSQSILNIAPSIFISSPSSDVLHIRYTMPKICRLEVKILDANGRVIKNLFAGRINSTSGALSWDTNNNEGEKVSSGVYYCLLETEYTKISKKFVITK